MSSTKFIPHPCTNYIPHISEINKPKRSTRRDLIFYGQLIIISMFLIVVNGGNIYSIQPVKY